MVAVLKPHAEYNRKAAIIEDLHTGHSATEIIWYFGCPSSTIYNVWQNIRSTRKIAPLAPFQWCLSIDFREPSTIVALIGFINFGYQQVNNVSNYRGRSSIQICGIRKVVNFSTGRFTGTNYLVQN